MKILQTTVALLTALMMLLATPFSAFAQVDNPPLPQSCEMDIVLVMDRSGSIDSTELQTEKDAFNAFVDTLMPFGSEMSLVSFASSATLDQDWTSSEATMHAAINAVTSGGSTNWAAALTTAHGQFDHRTPDADFPNLIVFASDGNPNVGGDGTTEADAIKSDGIRIETIGIGDNLDEQALKDISSDDAFHAAADFDQLQDELEQIAKDACDQVGEKEPHNVTVTNNNGAEVENVVIADSNTGGNTAGGSTGGNGGRGGDIYNGRRGDDVERSSTGNGGNGGDAGVGEGDNQGGGLVVSGNANATAGAENVVNVNTTSIDRCACNGEDWGDDTVRNRNRAGVGNLVVAGAGSGYNRAHGSDAGNGNRGGDISNSGDDVERSNTGRGGNGGDAGPGGTVLTGRADSLSGVLNAININTTRIRR